MPTVALLLVAMLLAASSALAQERPPINPDRPGVSTGADVVVRGSVQVETGVDYARERKAGEPTEHRTSWALSVRYGLLDSLELRLDAEPIVGLSNGDNVTNVGDFQLGVKWRLLEGAPNTLIPVFSLFPGVKLPTAPDPIGNERVDVTVMGLASWQAGPLAIDFNAGVAVIAQHHPSGYLAQAIVALAVTGDLTETVKPFGEFFYFSRSERDGSDRVGATVGATWIVTPDLALDLAAITTLVGRGPDYRLQAGVSMRFWP